MPAPFWILALALAGSQSDSDTPRQIDSDAPPTASTVAAGSVSAAEAVPPAASASPRLPRFPEALQRLVDEGHNEDATPARKVRTAAELVTDINASLRATARVDRSDPAEVVPRLVALYRELQTAEMTASTRRSLQGQLKRRLREFDRRLVRENPAVARQRNELPRRPPSFNAPGDSRTVVELIDLIQTTIAPDNWDVRGGQGSIRYYSRNPALVIRATGEVHEQIGGALGR